MESSARASEREREMGVWCSICKAGFLIWPTPDERGFWNLCFLLLILWTRVLQFYIFNFTTWFTHSLTFDSLLTLLSGHTVQPRSKLPPYSTKLYMN